MARTPCCEKMGMKKGPWTPEEDQILISYIQQHGHTNWRALPKQAGLLRCGKSCRLRWINYLRPDIKRGKFSNEEQDTIIKLHQILGNRWAAIAARLPGRTDNEIKNFWHTHLKKRLQRVSEIGNPHPENASSSYLLQQSTCSSSEDLMMAMPHHHHVVGHGDASSSGTNGNNLLMGNESSDSAAGDPAATEHCTVTSITTSGSAVGSRGLSNISEEMEFWYNLYMRTGKPSQGHQNL